MGLGGVVIFVNGTVGVGKTTTINALGEYLTADQVPHAVIDLDEIRRAWPSVPGDPFNHRLELQNLRSLAANYRAAGITTLVVAGVIENRAALARYEDVFDRWQLFIVRLSAREEIRRARITARHADDPAGRQWHLARTVELETILDAGRLEDVLVDTSNQPPADVARHIAEAALMGAPA